MSAISLGAVARKKAYHRAYNRRYQYDKRRKSPEDQVKWLLTAAARDRARARGLEFSVTLADLLPLPERCPLLGVEMVYNVGRLPNGPSIDRKDSSKGYVPGNVWVVSNRANRLKSDATRKELQNIVANWPVT